ncbi:iron chelate uptake ABC transporter family permease subunit [Aeromicrobium sp. Marseille-Q0843]|uniref:Iron chelate uptake ABC transporter family permease subunit n=1 Tax=Aeromicrobium phoceense TaxID=2754045 RepID=A0A838XSF0_9ACTN|nr:iron chelate uptake ABC transporter family permease subunit [Aeromicrobium phoceense]MBA4609830.1 iron chelate uptake ABC transporter family permease subunit [Aeromicrobium phoceense]
MFALVATLVAAGLAVMALTIGDYGLSPSQVLRALAGDGSDPLAEFFVREQRAPRVVCALLVGAALGVSGAIIQQVSDNPLGSPDIVGFTIGAATGALIQITVLGGGPDATAPAALVGGLVTAAVVGALAWQGGRHGGIPGVRLVLVGIGVAAVLQAVNTLLVVRADLSAAQDAAHWLAGSFNAMTWQDVARLGLVLAVVAPFTAALARTLPVLALGDDAARGIGVPVESSRLALVVCGVVLVAAATAVAGPIAFIALAAPQLARRITRTAGSGLASAALMGAALTLASDIVAQRLFAPTQLPVGVVSGSLGGLYLIWLLTREKR